LINLFENSPRLRMYGVTPASKSSRIIEEGSFGHDFQSVMCLVQPP
jgi:hypothetical protein